MIVQVYAIWDAKVCAYQQPFFNIADGAAVRAFADTCADSGTMLHRHPEDFTLFRIGLYNDQDAQLLSEAPAPAPLCKALDFVRRSPLDALPREAYADLSDPESMELARQAFNGEDTDHA